MDFRWGVTEIPGVSPGQPRSNGELTATGFFRLFLALLLVLPPGVLHGQQLIRSGGASPPPAAAGFANQIFVRSPEGGLVPATPGQPALQVQIVDANGVPVPAAEVAFKLPVQSGLTFEGGLLQAALLSDDRGFANSPEAFWPEGVSQATVRVLASANGVSAGAVIRLRKSGPRPVQPVAPPVSPSRIENTIATPRPYTSVPKPAAAPPPPKAQTPFEEAAAREQAAVSRPIKEVSPGASGQPYVTVKKRGSGPSKTTVILLLVGAAAAGGALGVALAGGGSSSNSSGASPGQSLSVGNPSITVGSQ
jgi:hypothetical protein